MNAEPTTTPARAGLPTRLIGYAWGDAYVDELLTFAIPALLAPGNLPAVVAQVQCELVLLSEERLFAKIAAHAAIEEVQKLCPVRLVGLDDLITRSDKYGMALTYVLHRGFADLGPAMTDTWLIFFNADFIMADGSLRNLLTQLMLGERIIASPSYCTVKEDVLPELKRRLVQDSTRLVLEPREMGAFILRHRHLTIRGKTINQHRFHLLQADQFYWQVDHKTLLGRQMPVAIVGMRPERYLAEPNSYWDHGLMLELCPAAEVKLLGDSDEFLMLELRSGTVAQEQIVAGPANPRDLAERMIGWVTPYQASFAHRPLVVHAADIPSAAKAADQELDAFVTKVFSYAPEFPSHLGHPQWDYHWPDFTKIRHSFLSTKLGSQTELKPPPSNMLAIDQIWWRLDGAEKSHARRMNLLKSTQRKMERELKQIDQRLSTTAVVVLGQIDIRNAGPHSDREGMFSNRELQAEPDIAESGRAGDAILNVIEDRVLSKRKEVEERKAKLQLAVKAAEEEYALGDEELRRARREYQRLLRPRVKSAGIPVVHWYAGDDAKARLARSAVIDSPPGAMPPVSDQAPFDVPWFQPSWQVSQEDPPANSKVAGEAWPRRVARKVYYRVFGRWPRVSILNPFWPAAQPLLAAIDAAKANGACDALVLVDAPLVFIPLAGLSGKVAHLAAADLQSELFCKAFEPKQFDLCVLQLKADDVPRLSELLATVGPYMRPGGRVIGFCRNGARSAAALVLDRPKSMVAFTGSAMSLRAMRLYSAAFNRMSGRRLLGVACGLLMLGASLPLVLWANCAEAAAARKGRLVEPAFRTSITIMVRLE